MVSTDGARIILLIFSAQLVNIVCGSSILFLSPLTAPSHRNFFKPAVKALAVRGHFVTYWNGLSQQHSAVLTRRSICVYFTRQKWRESNRTLESDFKTDSPFRLFFDIPGRLAKYCDAIYQDPFSRLVHSKERYDLLIVEDIFIEVLRFAFGKNFRRSVCLHERHRSDALAARRYRLSISLRSLSISWIQFPRQNGLMAENFQRTF